jgi:hypothetical protein
MASVQSKRQGRAHGEQTSSPFENCREESSVRVRRTLDARSGEEAEH